MTLSLLKSFVLAVGISAVIVFVTLVLIVIVYPLISLFRPFTEGVSLAYALRCYIDQVKYAVVDNFESMCLAWDEQFWGAE